MLISLDIKNIALIEQINLEPQEGMTVLTGETGAGKSIIIDAVNLLLGSRTNKGLVRYGTEKARVSGIFTSNPDAEKILSEYGIDAEDEIFVSRDITADGKSVCRINGSAVPQNVLKAVGEYLINIHGQQDNQAILNTSKHLGFLDKYAKTDLTKYQELYSQLTEKKQALASLLENISEREQRLDLLRYQVEEITSAQLVPDEKEQLYEDRNYLMNAEKIVVSLNDAKNALYDDNSAYDRISDAVTAIERVSGISSNIDEIAEKLRDALYNVEECVHQLRKIADDTEYDENALNEIEARLDLISKLERKYGGTIEAVLEFGKKAQEELLTLENAEENTQILTDEIALLEEKITAEAKKITAHRRKFGDMLQVEIENSLKDMDMPKVQFLVAIEHAQFTKSGCDSVEFMLCPNPGEPIRPLVEIASGGELSRVMLAVKSILAEGADTLIFDEVDTGVSGNAAQKIARKLKELSKGKQVICVSHQPQIAALCDNHVKIAKSQDGDRTVTELFVLSMEDRIGEIARIIDGDNYTDTALQHAKEMLSQG